MVLEKLKILMKQTKLLNRKRILLVTFLTSACLLLTAFGLYTQLRVQVTVNLNGVEQEVRTQAQTVEQLLNELGVEYKEQDHLIPDLNTAVEAKMHVLWREAVEVEWNYYGSVSSVLTTAETVEDFLLQQDVVLKEGDLLSVQVDSPIHSGMELELLNQQYKFVEEEQIVEYKVIRKEDPSMLQGQEKIVTEGKEGKALNKFMEIYVNGQLMNRKLLGTEVLGERRDQVLAVGTTTTVSRGSYVFAPRKILENVKLTAYAAGVVHTGKAPGDKGYGITRTGTTVAEGRTIAVDPDVIPLGSWVYIEGIGLRKAEDTGSAVKGKKIDIYFEEHSTAVKFGLKKGYKVYVLGKKKPHKQ
jgi:uncharacterized protein YabE (DUF348 family)